MKKLFFLSVLLFGIFSFSQTLSSTLNKTTLALGEPAVLKINIENLQGKDVKSAPKNELLPFHLEETKDEIIKKQNNYTREIEFAVFEEGKFQIPALDFKIGENTYKTIPYEIEVINTAKKGDKISDIMNNKEVKLGLKDYWQLYKFYVLGAIALIALFIIIYYFIRYSKREKNTPKVISNKTLKDLELLKKKKYIENGNYRLFYVELLEITRNFISTQYRIPANVLLTDDLIDFMKQNNTISQENEKVVEDIFLRGDLVKFAKTFPDKETMGADFNDIKDFVKRSSKDIEFENIRSDV
ncbi:BatD family protein [Halpernia sp.]|uniref:BatD family protein n=1 Tax=Halpernia sp. TaxID=2782209 RepID=UPI003A8F9878